MNGDLQKMLWTKEEEEGGRRNERFCIQLRTRGCRKDDPHSMGGGVGSQTMTRAA